MPSKRKKTGERYELSRSPLAQKPTQRELAKLVGMKRDELRSLATHREMYTVRRDEVINGKLRHLAYPNGKLRRVHERLAFHLKKIQQPDYLFSPRKGCSQRDNADLHRGQNQYLTLDIKQFYPSTLRSHIFHWAKHEMGMVDDVAGLFTLLVTVDGVASFGSPLTPVLATLVHRRLFDSIYALCRRRGLRFSIWVDDLTISGKFVPGLLLNEIREAIRKHGLRSHKLRYWNGNRYVSVTGLLIAGDALMAPRNLHDRIRELYASLAAPNDDAHAEQIINRLLSSLGTLRYITGRPSAIGRKTADRMNTLRRRRTDLNVVSQTRAKEPVVVDASDDIPWM